MNHANVLYHMVKADFLERVRRYSFLVTLAGALYLAYGVAAEKVVIVVGGHYRGQYNSAWIGMLMSTCCSVFLSLFGFYIVKNSIERDSGTRVGRILAATPMRKEFYTLAKTVSNFAVLACMVMVLMAAAVVMQWLRPEARPISLWQLWSPFMLIALPAMFVTASLAILFETLPVMRGGVGNIVYFFLWTFGLVAAAQKGLQDAAGMHILAVNIRQVLERINPGDVSNSSFSLTIGGDHATKTFLWNGIDWNPRAIAWRLIWVAAGAGIALIASVFFHRFDPAREHSSKMRRKYSADAEPALVSKPVRASLKTLSLAQIPLLGRSRFARMVASELALMLKGLHWWWYAVAGALLIAQFASPLTTSEGVLVAAWIWPVLLWSQMGCRESRHTTQSLIFSAARVTYHQLFAIWTAGFMVAILTGAGAGLHLLLSGDPQFAAWLAGALFIPSLALALGTWSGSSKFFEALYTLWWYIGPAHQSPGLDFMGTSSSSSSPLLYLALAAGTLLAACVARRRQVAYA